MYRRDFSKRFGILRSSLKFDWSKRKVDGNHSAGPTAFKKAVENRRPQRIQQEPISTRKNCRFNASPAGCLARLRVSSQDSSRYVLADLNEFIARLQRRKNLIELAAFVGRIVRRSNWTRAEMLGSIRSIELGRRTRFPILQRLKNTLSNISCFSFNSVSQSGQSKKQ